MGIKKMKQTIKTIGARNFTFTLFENGSAEISKAIRPIEKVSLNREQVLDIHDEIASFYNLPAAPKDPPLKEAFNPLEPDKGAHRIILPDKKSKEIMKKRQEKSLTRMDRKNKEPIRFEKRYYTLIEFGSVDDDKKHLEKIVEDILSHISGRLININPVRSWSEDEPIFNSSEEKGVIYK